MGIVDRVKNICVMPSAEWPVIAAEPASPGSLVTGYVLPLAAVGAAAGFVGGSLIGRTLPYIGTYRTSLGAGLAIACFTVIMAVVGVFVLSFIINALAPSFGGQKDSTQAFKVAVYSYTPAWVAAVLNIVPVLGALAVLGGLYGLYLLYLGLPRLMKCPEDRAAGYTAVVVVCAIVLSIVITVVGGTVAGLGMVGAGVAGGPIDDSHSSGGQSEVQFDRDSPLGKLQELGKKMEESGRKMEAAEKSGDAAAQTAAVLEGLGTLLGGGRRVDPIAISELKPFVPETFAGLPKKSSNAEKTGIVGVMVSNTEATYEDDADRRVTLKISDSGGASGLVGLVSWANLREEREDDNGSERTLTVGGRLVHEKTSTRRGGTNEFSLVLGDRFVVSATGVGVDLAELKTAVTSLDLTRLESMKDVGVTQ
jgi:hypothetical protein